MRTDLLLHAFVQGRAWAIRAGAGRRAPGRRYRHWWAGDDLARRSDRPGRGRIVLALWRPFARRRVFDYPIGYT